MKKRDSDSRSWWSARRLPPKGYKVITKIKIGGTGGWDYVAVDRLPARLYASHGTEVEVVDLEAGKVVGISRDLHGVHGIAVAPNSARGSSPTASPTA